MLVKLNKKVSETVKELAKTMGMSEEDVVNRIIEWYIEDLESEN